MTGTSRALEKITAHLKATHTSFTKPKSVIVQFVRNVSSMTQKVLGVQKIEYVGDN